MGRKLTILLLVVLASMNLAGQDIRGLLPALQELPGWQFKQEPQVYDGDRLFELIDGGADIYMEYGFTQVISAQYVDPSKISILAEIYEMTDDASAYGIFSITQQTADWSKEYGNLSAISADYLSFWKGKYYVNISWSSGQNINNAVPSNLAGIIAGKIIEQGDFPSFIKDFLYTNDSLTTIYFKGSLGLSNFYYFDYKDIFNVTEGLARTFGNQHHIILKYKDQAIAADVAASSEQSISSNKRFTEVAEASPGYSCKDNKGNMILVRQVGQFIVIIVGLNRETDLASAMDELALKIQSISR